MYFSSRLPRPRNRYHVGPIGQSLPERGFSVEYAPGLLDYPHLELPRTITYQHACPELVRDEIHVGQTDPWLNEPSTLQL